MTKALSAFIATVAGKVALGTAVAAASVGGLQAADVIDVVPDRGRPATAVTTAQEDETNDVESEDEIGSGEAEGEANAAAAEEHVNALEAERQAFLDQLDTWTTCVAENASARGDTQSDPATRTEGEFDPTTACGAKPEPTWTDDGSGEAEGPAENEDRRTEAETSDAADDAANAETGRAQGGANASDRDDTGSDGAPEDAPSDEGATNSAGAGGEGEANRP